MAKKTYTSKTIFLSDIHIPYQDKKALALAMNIIKDYSLTEDDTIVLGGDLVDYYPISNFSPDLTNSNIDIELFETTEFLNDLRKLAPKTNFIYFEGNHEQRMQKK